PGPDPRDVGAGELHPHRPQAVPDATRRDQAAGRARGGELVADSSGRAPARSDEDARAALGRQPAEGRAREVAATRAPRDPARRAHAGHRRRREGAHPRPDPEGCRRGGGGDRRNLGRRGDPRRLRPRVRASRRGARRRPRAERALDRRARPAEARRCARDARGCRAGIDRVSAAGDVSTGDRHTIGARSDGGDRLHADGRVQKWLARSGLERLSALYLWAGFTLLFGLLEPAFLSSTTFQLVFGEGVVTCVLALAFLIPLAAGIYDLSVAAVMSLALCISVYLNLHTSLPSAVGACIAVASSVAVGFVSGFIVVRLRVNSFIATLGVAQVLLAAVIELSDNRQLVGNFSSGWSQLGNRNLAGIPVVDVYLLAIALVLWFVL